MQKLNILLLNLWFYFWNPLLFAVYLPFGVMLVALSRVLAGRRACMRSFRRAIAGYGRLVCYSGWPWIRVVVRNCPSPDAGPFIIIENHCSSFDAFVQGFLPFEIVQAARGWALRFPILGFFARWTGYLDVDASGAEDLQRRAEEHLRNGISLVFFPEGTRHSDYCLGAFHSTAFRVAASGAYPILPLALIGTAGCPPKGSIWFRPRKIELICLEPLMPEDFAGESVFSLKKTTRERILYALKERGIKLAESDDDDE